MGGALYAGKHCSAMPRWMLLSKWWPDVEVDLTVNRVSGCVGPQIV